MRRLIETQINFLRLPINSSGKTRIYLSITLVIFVACPFGKAVRLEKLKLYVESFVPPFNLRLKEKKSPALFFHLKLAEKQF